MCSKIDLFSPLSMSINLKEESIKCAPNHEIQSEFHEDRGNSDRGEEEGNASRGKLEKSVGDEEEELEGFTTPTSLDHKIPAIAQCPPPPGKTRTWYPTLKRPEFRRRLLFFTAAEIESLFLSPISGGVVNVEEKKSKKARTAQ
ncbi:cyclin-dependent protein kinase inhibitor SMR12-like [Salvia hispanica]|uniref:cyclin-dependent protein kinase inhibitor SMR12-like n=1 Tax=Salvia hispanica TaxID=49212 RepID=UPI0020098EBD|nr:cyclin-dependent protein kinase inhibitor SMR12-like [Salvia hispanica]